MKLMQHFVVIFVAIKISLYVKVLGFKLYKILI